MKYALERFEKAQAENFSTALAEVKKGQKRSHWMWYIFPQLAGLGRSETAKFYSIADLSEAAAFLEHPVLGNNFLTISRALLALPENNATSIFGQPDDQKLHSSMTLFSLLPGTDPVFQQVLDKYFNGKKDQQTIQLLQ